MSHSSSSPSLPPIRVFENRWAIFEPPRRSLFCPGWRGYLLPNRSVVQYQWFCRSPNHRPCAVHYAQRHLRHLQEVFDRYPAIWFATVPFETGLANRLGQRRHATGAESVTIRRVGDRVDMYASARLGGKRSPMHDTWVDLTPGQALRLAADFSLALPGLLSGSGVAPISYSKGWRRPGHRGGPGEKREDRPRAVPLPPTSHEGHLQTAVNMAAEAAGEEFGVEFRLEVGNGWVHTFDKLPLEVPAEWFVETVERCLRELRG